MKLFGKVIEILERKLRGEHLAMDNNIGLWESETMYVVIL